jgi:hypothetical protein
MQESLFNKENKAESYERKLYRLNQKWMVESNLWLTFLIIVELISIYRLARLHDKREAIAKEMNLSSEEMKKIENDY